ncbi:glycosyltransferase family 4 protein [Roseicyclus amphidinii]|uniref:glycosyltransferase family 4 protein n=1 Tax=Roseicyclus amphidinii TaxID=3034232 RepID=UPI0024E0FF03|nr:glycosyltransferase family 4 protein [Roseicyclus sp. Amp-Y-6]
MTRVLHVSTHDLTGGAAIAANRLHKALTAQGVASRMAVRRRRSEDETVLQIRMAPLARVAPRRLWTKLARRMGGEQAAIDRAITSGHAYFSTPWAPGHDLRAAAAGADIVNLHWVTGFLDYRSFFGTHAHGQPLVWTLHDMAPMTGGCHYALSCDRFTGSCGACPLLGGGRETDLSRRIHDSKREALARLAPETTRIVAPSRWLAAEARRSSLLSRFDVEVIPNGLDIDGFAPRDRAQARKMLGLPQDDLILLFGAHGLSDPRKGMDLLHAALAGVDRSARPVTLATLGGGKGPDGSIALGHIDDVGRMSLAYSAADLLVLPTRAEAFGQVLSEAMSCGTPCVSFRVGGVPDVVRHGQTGLLAEPEDVASLRQAIETLLHDDVLRQRMGRASREIAVSEFADTSIAGRYGALYDTLIDASRAVQGRATPSR